MKILSVDTSTWAETVAVMEDGNLLSERIVVERESHNRRLLETIDSLLRDLELSIGDIDAFSVGLGPGSFTGIRIGITTVKALAWSLGKPVVGISSLDALAAPFGSGDDYYVCPMIDARKREVYYAFYRADGSGRPVRESRYRVTDPLKIAEEINAMEIKKIVFCGDGWKIYKSNLMASVKCRVVDPPDVFNVIRASFLGMLAWHELSKGYVSSPFELVPLYVRPSEAELKRVEVN